MMMFEVYERPSGDGPCGKFVEMALRNVLITFAFFKRRNVLITNNAFNYSKKWSFTTFSYGVLSCIFLDHQPIFDI